MGMHRKIFVKNYGKFFGKSFGSFFGRNFGKKNDNFFGKILSNFLAKMLARGKRPQQMPVRGYQTQQMQTQAIRQSPQLLPSLGPSWFAALLFPADGKHKTKNAEKKCIFFHSNKKS